MPIGVFDSGIGGLTIHRALINRLPAADFVYLADQAHMPYGTRTGEEIVRLTRTGCERLFHEGCDLVVLACNTASAVALRRLQQTWLPDVRQMLGRAVNVLGIIVPTIEVATGRPWDPPHALIYNTSGSQEVLGIFATQATARSRVYEIEVAKRRRDLSVVTEACPGLAALIEQGSGAQELSHVIEKHVGAMVGRIGRLPDKVILGSTHYEVVADLFRRALSDTTELIQQPRATADALEAYLARHREFRPGTKGLRRFLTTGRPGIQHAWVKTYWGQSLSFETA
jgi:glutamate racemase